MVYTGSGNVPYVQFESVGDFIPKPRCSKFAVGLQTRRRKIGGTRGSVGRTESDRSSAMSKVFKRVLVVRTWWFCGCKLVNLVDLMILDFLG